MSALPLHSSTAALSEYIRVNTFVAEHCTAADSGYLGYLAEEDEKFEDAHKPDSDYVPAVHERNDKLKIADVDKVRSTPDGPARIAAVENMLGTWRSVGFLVAVDLSIATDAFLARTIAGVANVSVVVVPVISRQTGAYCVNENNGNAFREFACKSFVFAAGDDEVGAFLVDAVEEEEDEGIKRKPSPDPIPFFVLETCTPLHERRDDGALDDGSGSERNAEITVVTPHRAIIVTKKGGAEGEPPAKKSKKR
jgi:hypothetical protein